MPERRSTCGRAQLPATAPRLLPAGCMPRKNVTVLPAATSRRPRSRQQPGAGRDPHRARAVARRVLPGPVERIVACRAALASASRGSSRNAARYYRPGPAVTTPVGRAKIPRLRGLTSRIAQCHAWLHFRPPAPATSAARALSRVNPLALLLLAAIQLPASRWCCGSTSMRFAPRSVAAAGSGATLRLRDRVLRRTSRSHGPRETVAPAVCCGARSALVQGRSDRRSDARHPRQEAIRPSRPRASTPDVLLAPTCSPPSATRPAIIGLIFYVQAPRARAAPRLLHKAEAERHLLSRSRP